MQDIVNRRDLIRMAAALGAAVALPGCLRGAPLQPRESRDHFPQGVASADPDERSVILWTRSPAADRKSKTLFVEVAEDAGFTLLAASGRTCVSARTDWTCRFLAAGLRPGWTYWYRFVDDQGNASRTGRTFTAPEADADSVVRFAFASCQNVNLGFSTPYRRMIEEDAARSESEQLRFVLHLGDFIYEMVWYPEDRPNGMQGRQVRDSVRLPHGEKIGDYHVPVDADDYRAIYRAYLSDPDLQDARARWPFVCVWDNHEFSNRGWQSEAIYDRARPGQTLKVAANQAWFEYVPARVRQLGPGSNLDRFDAPVVENRALSDFDSEGLSHEPNNLRAINSLVIARTLRWGRHVELVLTDNRSFRSQPVMDSPSGQPFRRSNLPYFVSQEVLELLDAGRTHAGGNPPEKIRFGGEDLPNPMRDTGPGSMLGVRQKSWFLERVRASSATWMLWGNSVGMLDLRADPMNLPAALASGWPADGHGVMGTHDWSGYATERAEILQAARESRARLVSIVGDRHAFYAGLLSPTLPPGRFSPVAAEFVVGSICTPTVIEAAADALPQTHPLAGLILSRAGDGAAPRPSLNLTLRHGVRAALEFARSGSTGRARALNNPDLAPHLAFADAAGHGFAIVEAASDHLDVEFVAVPAPLTPRDDAVLYRVAHRLEPWEGEAAPRLRRLRADGPALSERFLDEADET